MAWLGGISIHNAARRTWSTAPPEPEPSHQAGCRPESIHVEWIVPLALEPEDQVSKSIRILSRFTVDARVTVRAADGKVELDVLRLVRSAHSSQDLELYNWYWASPAYPACPAPLAAMSCTPYRQTNKSFCLQPVIHDSET